MKIDALNSQVVNQQNDVMVVRKVTEELQDKVELQQA